MNTRINGFTLIELMTVLVVLVILALVATPSLQKFQARQELRGFSSDLRMAFGTARARAMSAATGTGSEGEGKHSGRTVIKAVNGDFANGWDIFEDKNKNGAWDKGSEWGQQTQLNNPKIKAPPEALCADPGAPTVTVTGAVTEIDVPDSYEGCKPESGCFAYESSGFLKAGSKSVSLKLLHNKSGEYRCFDIYASGALRVSDINPAQ